MTNSRPQIFSAAARVLVNRDYCSAIKVALNDSRTLKIEIDQGNDRTSCDWFSIGFGAIER